MSSRLLRPALSPRYRTLNTVHRRNTTSVSQPPRAFYQFSRGTWVVFAIVFTAGCAAGTLARRNVTKAPYPIPGSREDNQLVAELTERIDKEFKVNVLRGKCLGVSKQLKGQEGGWVELVQSRGDELSMDALRTSLAGARGLGVERLFWNHDTENLVAIIWFGPSMSGWPNVTHGGVIATQLMEKVGLAMTLLRGATSSVSRAAKPERLPGTGNHAKMPLPLEIEEPKELSLSYVKPTMTENFYVIRVGPALPLDTDPEHFIPPEPPGGTHNWEATLETMDARILVKAKAKCARRLSLAAVEERIESAAQQSYETFRQWMWPSRQGSLER